MICAPTSSRSKLSSPKSRGIEFREGVGKCPFGAYNNESFVPSIVLISTVKIFDDPLKTFFCVVC